MAKEEIDHNQQFLIFPHYVQLLFVIILSFIESNYDNWRLNSIKVKDIVSQGDIARFNPHHIMFQKDVFFKGMLCRLFNQLGGFQCSE